MTSDFVGEHIIFVNIIYNIINIINIIESYQVFLDQKRSNLPLFNQI